MKLNHIHPPPSPRHLCQFVGSCGKKCAFRPYTLCRLSPLLPSLHEPSRTKKGQNYRISFTRNSFRDKRGSGFWDSNAENIGDGKFKGRNPVVDDDEYNDSKPWWSSFSGEEEYDSEEEDDDFDDGSSQSWGNIGMQKAFRTLSWIWPAVLIPWLLGNPMALMMALVVPFAQTAVGALFQQVWKPIIKGFAPAPAKSKPRRKSRFYRKTKKQSDSRYSNSYESGSPQVNGQQSAPYNEPQTEESSSMPREARQKSSWADFDEPRSDGASSGLSLGGWEDLDNSMKSPVQTVSQKKRSKLTRKISKREVPLFFRLLIALFPFLGFWGKFL
eukprot:Gb_35904 [translate_table: standard]